MIDLTVIGFAIAVVGIILQLTDAFPQHREIRTTIVSISIGVFIGIAASALLGAEYKVTGNVDRSFALLYILVAAGALFGLLAIFVNNQDARLIASILAGATGGLFLLVGFAVALGSGGANNRYSIDEILALASIAERQGQYDIAIDRLQEVQLRVDTQKGREVVADRIRRMERLQLKAGSQLP